MTDYERGFADAKKKIRASINAVPTETSPERQPFSYDPQTPSPRLPNDVLNDCLRAAENAKPD